MSQRISRRALLQNLCGTAVTGIIAPQLRGFPHVPAPEQDGNGSRAAMFRIARAFMVKYEVPGLSISITRSGKFVYEHQFGMAVREQAQQLLPNSLFRIASVTKPITSVTIFTLIEKGKLNLNDKVFGPSGVLDDKYGKQPYKQYVTDITVDHLLTHTCGGWPNDSTDPMFRFDSWDQAKLISWTLEKLPLTYPPGQHWAYSNFGCCVLGRVIEKVGGQPYKDYVQQVVLTPCGITDMQIAGNTLKQRAPNEAMYYGQFGENSYNMNVTRMDSHGGWIASPADLGRFCAHVGRSARHPQHPEARDHSDHYDACPGLSADFSSEVRARLDGARQRQRQLEARWQPARHDQHHGSHLERHVLGRAHQYPHATFGHHQHRPRSNGLGHGQQSSRPG